LGQTIGAISKRVALICAVAWQRCGLLPNYYWAIYLSVAFAWVSGSVIAAAVSINTSGLVNGKCLSRFFWKSQKARMAYGIWYVLSFYVLILLIVVLSYWRILVTIRRQASVVAAHSGAAASSTQTKSTCSGTAFNTTQTQYKNSAAAARSTTQIQSRKSGSV